MARKALEVATAFALFAILIFGTYYAWTQSGVTPPTGDSARDGELQASPPVDPPNKKNEHVQQSEPTPLAEPRRTSKPAPSAEPRRLPGLGAPLPEHLSTLLEKWHAPVLQAHVATSMGHATPTHQNNITITAERLSGTVLRPGEAFSFIYGLGPFDRAHGYGCGRTFVAGRIVKSVGGGVCQVASTLYNAVVLSGLKVLERHRHSLTVPYLPPGQDATISGSSGKDFRFLNDSASPVVIWAATSADSLHTWIFGRRPPPRVTWRHETLGRTPFKTVRQQDASLPAGETRVESPGQPGVTVHSVVVVTRDGKSSPRDLGTATYRPSPRIVRVGTG